MKRRCQNSAAPSEDVCRLVKRERKERRSKRGREMEEAKREMEEAKR